MAERVVGKEDFGPLVKARLTDEQGRIIAPGIERPDGVVPEQRKLPSVKDMLQLSDVDLLRELQYFGIIDPWNKLKTDAAKYVTLRSQYIPGTEAFEAEVRRITETASRRGLLGLTRRTHERYTTMVAIDGNAEQELIRISEGDTHVCENCAELEGTVGTLAEHTALGLPGAQSCLGGDYCRCTLVRIS